MQSVGKVEIWYSHSPSHLDQTICNVVIPFNAINAREGGGGGGRIQNAMRY